MKFQKRFLALIIATVLLSASAFAKPRFSIVGAGLYGKPTTSGIANTYKEKLGFGGGLLMELKLGAKGGLELGALYLQRWYDDTVSGATNTITATYIQAPLLLRFWLNPTISLGAGGYFASGYGKLKRGSESLTFSDYGIKPQDYGVIGALGFSFRLGGSTALLIDGRYTLGLANMANASGLSFKTTSIDGLIGLRFGGGK